MSNCVMILKLFYAIIIKNKFGAKLEDINKCM